MCARPTFHAPILRPDWDTGDFPRAIKVLSLPLGCRFLRHESTESFTGIPAFHLAAWEHRAPPRGHLRVLSCGMKVSSTLPVYPRFASRHESIEYFAEMPPLCLVAWQCRVLDWDPRIHFKTSQDIYQVCVYIRTRSTPRLYSKNDVACCLTQVYIQDERGNAVNVGTHCLYQMLGDGRVYS